jgi:hypothetical protein
VGVYVITFNSPNQLQTLIDSVELEILEIDKLFSESNLPDSIDVDLINEKNILALKRPLTMFEAKTFIDTKEEGGEKEDVIIPTIYCKPSDTKLIDGIVKVKQNEKTK